MASDKLYQVRTVHTGDRQWEGLGAFGTLEEAMAVYERARQGRGRDRFYVVDISNNDTVVADTHPPRR